MYSAGPLSVLSKILEFANVLGMVTSSFKISDGKGSTSQCKLNIKTSGLFLRARSVEDRCPLIYSLLRQQSNEFFMW